jgi:threonine synthase
MGELASSRRFQVDKDTFGKMRELFSADFVTNPESLATVRRVWEEHGYLLDPHTAVAWEVAERLRADDPVLVVSTAHWAKFGADVYRALKGLPYGEPLPEDVASLTGVELLARVQEMAPEGACVPRALAELDAAPVRFPGVVDAGREGVEGAVRSWVG